MHYNPQSTTIAIEKWQWGRNLEILWEAARRRGGSQSVGSLLLSKLNAINSTNFPSWCPTLLIGRGVLE